jgi:hypothetical protein
LAGLLYQRAYIIVWSLATILIIGTVIILRRRRTITTKAQRTSTSERGIYDPH